MSSPASRAQCTSPLRLWSRVNSRVPLPRCSAYHQPPSWVSSTVLSDNKYLPPPGPVLSARVHSRPGARRQGLRGCSLHELICEFPAPVRSARHAKHRVAPHLQRPPLLSARAGPSPRPAPRAYLGETQNRSPSDGPGRGGGVKWLQIQGGVARGGAAEDRSFRRMRRAAPRSLRGWGVRDATCPISTG